jgi:membrane fusion protein, multidrug efflux system
MRRKFYLLMGVCLILFAITGCGRSKKAEETVPVIVRKIGSQNMQRTLDYAGDIKAAEAAVVYPRVGGKIMEKLKEDGSAVSKGDVIAYIDRDEVGFEFQKAPVESPLDGIVGRFYVDKGVNVTAQTPIALIVDMDNVEIELDIPEKYVPKVSVGQLARIYVDAYPEEHFEGKVTKVSPVIDLETRTAPIELTFSNANHELKPGMFARVELIIEQHERIPVVPKESIIGEKVSPYVYIVRDNTASRRNVKLGMRKGANVEVIDGIKENELIVVLGQRNLRDGARVNMEYERSDR